MSPRWRALLVVAALAAPCAPCLAAQLPVPSKGDARIRFVDYDPYNVVTIYAKIGISTMVLFEPGERIVNKDSGDTKAWGYLEHEQKDGFTVKPSDTVVATNVQIRTTKRVYHFEMLMAPAKQVPFYAVHFRYPTVARAADVKATEEARVKTLLDQVAPSASHRYTVEGSSDIAPLDVWDDGTFTYMRFAPRATPPSIYVPRADNDAGLERIADSSGVQNTPAGDVVRLPGVRAKFVLRVGRVVACVYNEAYDPNAAQATTTGTVSPSVRRVISKGKQP